MSSASLEYDKVEDDKKSATKVFTDQMKSLRGDMRRLSKTIREKSEHRLVTCTVMYHVPEIGMKRIVRDDTGEIVRDEQMTGEERQANLFDDPEAQPKPKKGKQVN